MSTVPDVRFVAAKIRTGKMSQRFEFFETLKTAFFLFLGIKAFGLQFF